MISNDIVKNYLTSPVRDIDAKVELYNGSTLLKSFSSRDKLIEFTVERIGEENKFFGFGIAQKINVKLIVLFCRAIILFERTDKKNTQRRCFHESVQAHSVSGHRSVAGFRSVCLRQDRGSC